MESPFSCIVAGRTFGQTLRDCRELEKQRQFVKCVEDLNRLISIMEDQSKDLTRTQLVSQHELLSLAYNSRGHVFYLMVEFNEAVEDFTRALQHNPRIAAAYYNRALVHYRMGRFDTAVADLHKALDLNRFFDEAKHSLELVLTDQETARQKKCVSQHRDTDSQASPTEGLDSHLIPNKWGPNAEEVLQSKTEHTVRCPVLMKRHQKDKLTDKGNGHIFKEAELTATGYQGSNDTSLNNTSGQDKPD